MGTKYNLTSVLTRANIARKEGNMKKTIIVFLAILGTLAAAAPAEAATSTDQYGTYVTRHTNVDGSAVQLAPYGPQNCLSVYVVNAPQAVANDIVYVAQYESAPDTTETTALASYGMSLYPVATSGRTYHVFENVGTDGKKYGINSRLFYAAAGGINSVVELYCVLPGQRR